MRTEVQRLRSLPDTARLVNVSMALEEYESDVRDTIMQVLACRVREDSSAGIDAGAGGGGGIDIGTSIGADGVWAAFVQKARRVRVLAPALQEKIRANTITTTTSNSTAKGDVGVNEGGAGGIASEDGDSGGGGRGGGGGSGSGSGSGVEEIEMKELERKGVQERKRPLRIRILTPPGSPPMHPLMSPPGSPLLSPLFDSFMRKGKGK